MEVRPIDANALFDALYDNEFQTLCPLDEVDNVIAAAPTLDNEPVRHGEWIEMVFTDTGKPAGYKCSECGLGARKKFAYCHCGAKMDGGTNNGL